MIKSILSLALMLPWVCGTGHVLAAAFDDYPNHPITLVVPSTPGGGTDTSSRIIAPKFAENLGKPIVIANKPGVSGNLGAAFVANSAPDGYTCLLYTSPSPRD